MALEELLAPAGSYEVLVIAVNAGADAVYIAGQNYGARAYAKNFTMDEIDEDGNKVYTGEKVIAMTDISRSIFIPDDETATLPCLSITITSTLDLSVKFSTNSIDFS